MRNVLPIKLKKSNLFRKIIYLLPLLMLSFGAYCQDAAFQPQDVTWSQVNLDQKPTINEIIEGLSTSDNTEQNSALMASQYFQKLYGNSGSNSFGKAILHQNNYYVLGVHVANATVTKLDIMGNLLWTTQVDFSSVWLDIAVNSSGDLILVGFYGAILGGNNSLHSMIGRLDPNIGTFGLLQTYDMSQNNDIFYKIYNNPNPSVGIQPFYITGLELLSSGIDNVNITTFSNDGSSVGFRKIYNSADDEFQRDIAIENNAGGMTLVGHKDNNGVTYSINNVGNYIGGRLFNVDTRFNAILARPMSPGYSHILAGPNITNNDAHIYKVNGSSVVYSYKIDELTTITQLYEDSGNNFFAIGNGLVSGSNRPVLLHFTDNGASLTLNWAKSFIDNETNYAGGYGQMISSSKYLYTDSRFGNTSGFGDYDGFISIDDATFDNCLDKMVTATLTPVQVGFMVFDAGIMTAQPPAPVNRMSRSIQYSSADVCVQACDFTYTILPCGKVQFNTNIANGQEYCWDFVSGQPCESNASNPMHMFMQNGTYNVCLSVVVNGQICTVCQNITITNADSLPPIIVCPPPLSIDCKDDPLDLTVTGQATATDNVTLNPTITYMDITQGNNCQRIIRRTWKATDACDNMSTCVQTITVLDKTGPIIICPPNITLPCDTDIDNNILTGNATATDDCSLVLSIVAMVGQGQGNGCQSTFPKTYTARDSCGNTSSCIQTITLIDNKPPTWLTGCGGNYTGQGILGANGLCTGLITVPTPTATDNCNPPVTITNNINGTSTAPSSYPAGQTVITWTAKDLCGNMIMCRDTVNIKPCGNGEKVDSLCGQTIITCFSGYLVPNNPLLGLNPNGNVVAIINNQLLSNTPPNGMNAVGVPMRKDIDWRESRMGQVFGIAIDKNNDIFVTATTIFGDFPFGSGGPGSIYKINHITGAVSNFVTTGSGAIGTNTLPNLGSGLGNICFDDLNNQFFVTNFQDGLIYRIDATTGNVLSTFNHIGLTTFLSSNLNFVPLGDRPFGVEVYNNRLYYTLWNEDSGRNSIVPVSNEVWSVNITGGDFVSGIGSNICEVKIPSYLSTNYSNVPSDIEISHEGKILIGERTMNNDIPTSIGYPAHASRILEYEKNGPFAFNCNPLWGSPKIFYVGNLGSNTNCAGGIDYGYGGYDVINAKPKDCDELIWSSGDALKFGTGQNYYPGDNELCYGLAGISANGNNNTGGPGYVKTDSYYIDLGFGKTEYGDVEIFRCITCPIDSTNCEGLSATVTPISSQNDSTCCYAVNLTNNVGPEITQICIDLFNSPLWGINTSTIITPGFTWSSVGPSGICIQNPAGIPVGTTPNVFEFCLFEMANTAIDTQCLVVSWYNGQVETSCKDTLKTYCAPPVEKDTCFTITNVVVNCDPEDDYSYCVSMTVTNISSYDAISFVLNSLPPGFSYSDCGCGGSTFLTLAWAFDWFSTPLTPTNSRNICVKITSVVPITSPTEICFTGSLVGEVVCCKSPFPLCIDLEPCCNPCESTQITARSMPMERDSCCYAIDLNYKCDYAVYDSISFNINNLDVFYGSYVVGSPDWILSSPSTPQNISIKPSTAQIESGMYNDILQFCLTDIDSPADKPQFVTVNFHSTTNTGKDTIACDTVLKFECIDKKGPCAFITNEKIVCDSNKYIITVTVQNVSNPDFTAGYLTVFPTPGISPNPISLSPPLPNDGSTRDVTFCYTPSTFPDADGKLIVIYKLTNLTGDSCCNGNTVIRDTLMLPSCDTCICSAEGVFKPNLVTNGTFSMGNIGFMSDLSNSCSCSANTYCVDNLFNDKCGGWGTSTGNPGNCLIVDGFNSGTNLNIWSQNISVTAGKTYKLCFETNSVYGKNLQNFSLDIGVKDGGGTFYPLAPPEPISNTAGVWVSHSLSFTIPSSLIGSLMLQINQAAVVPSGYSDFGIDNICLTETEIVETCCTTLQNLCDNVENAISVNVDNSKCKVTINIGNLPQCDVIESINWGIGPNQFGPFDAGDMIMHTYSASGSYIISYLAIERDPFTGLICFEKVIRDTITVQCTACMCDSTQLWYGVGHGPILPKSCGDTLYVPENLPISFGYEFHCKGANCDTTQGNVSYTLTGPNGFPTQSGINPNITNGTFTLPGTYCLTLIGTCGMEKCTCKVYFVTPVGCCKDKDVFCAIVENAITTMIDNVNCKVKVNIGNLPPCGDYIDKINWGDGSTDNTDLVAGDMAMHTYAATGTYIISYLAIEVNPFTGFICFEKFIRDTITVQCTSPNCECKSFSGLSFHGGNWPNDVAVNCNETVKLPCREPIGNKLFYFHGNISCSDKNCLKDTVGYQIIQMPAGTVVLTGQVPLSYISGTTGHFDITLSPFTFTTGVQYMIVVTGQCGANVCKCKISFIIPPCPCKCDQIHADVNNGFQVSGKHLFGSCKRTIKPITLCTNDVVNWTVNGVPLPGNTVGNSPNIITFSGSGIHTVCMQVVRTDPSGQKCESKICRTVTIHCGIIIDDPKFYFCKDNVIWDGDFNEDLKAGHLGIDGNIKDWWIFPNNGVGNVRVVDSTGSGDFGHLILNGGKDNFAGIWQKVDIKEENFTNIRYDFKNYLGSHIPEGTRLEFRLEADTVPGGPSQVLFTHELKDTSSTWMSYEMSMQKNINPDFKFLIICAQNDDSKWLSAIGIDNIEMCFTSTFISKVENIEKGVNKLTIFPNPTTSILNLQFARQLSENATIEVIDVLGKITHVTTIQRGELSHQLDLSPYSSGMYLIKVTDRSHNTVMKKVIKLD